MQNCHKGSILAEILPYGKKMESYDSEPKEASGSKKDWKAIHKEALSDFQLCQDHEQHNREEALDDLKFARLGKQWPDEVVTKRQAEGRPCMTFNRMVTFIRSVVNDGRINKPAIKVHPADDKADVQTAEIINGIIRNIEYDSAADVAYDTGLDFAASCGIGYWRVALEYAHDDTFDMDIRIQRIANPFTVYGDYASTEADSSDWNRAFVVDKMPREAFKRKYKNSEPIDWESDAYSGMPDEWREGNEVLVAEYWRRKEVPRTICLMSNGIVVEKEWLASPVPDMVGVTQADIFDAQGVTVQDERETRSYKVTQYLMTGVEILQETEWAGCFIPIVPIYGEEVNVEGKRYFRSLIRDAKDAQRNFNYWRTTSTELVALAPKAPFIGKVGQFDTDQDKWMRANVDTLPFLEYDDPDGSGPPQRQPFAGVPAGALQEALNASDDMKAVIGIYDAGLGARSNETSGVAISARKAESDTSTFHFIDNQARAIAHTGRIILELIPKVYNRPRIMRVMGMDKTPQNVPVNQQVEAGLDENGMNQVFDLTVGKYDLTVDTGPSFQTKREEAAFGMTELVRAYPPAAAVIAPRLAKAQDWPEAQEIAKELAMLSPTAGGSPEAQAAQQQIQQMGQQLQQVTQQLNDKQADREIDAEKVRIDAFKAETDRLKALGLTIPPEMAAAMGFQTAQAAQQALTGPDLLPGATPQEEMPMAPEDQLQQGPTEQQMQMAAIMEEMRSLRQMMSAPRRKRLVRGEDGRAMEAIEEIMLPEQQPTEQIPEQGMEG